MGQWHVRTVAQAVAALSVDPAIGLDSAEAARRLLASGPNRLAAKKRKGLLRRLLEQLQDVLIYILMAAAAISVLLGEASDAVIILAVVVINAVVGVIQESKAEKALEALKKLSAPRAVVVRDGSPRELASEDIVPGDIVVIEAGRVIPCDLRWIEAVNLKVEEASLTGESVPVEKRADLVIDADAPLGDRLNLGYSSTLATYGRGLGLAVETGMDTELGRIAAMIEAEEQEETPLQRKLDGFGRKLGVVILVLCGALFALAAGKELVLHGAIPRGTLFELFLTSISLAVAAIPEGMVAIVTIVLAIGVQRMSRERAIVRRLPAVETLGAVTMICSDKTGTLTGTGCPSWHGRAMALPAIPPRSTFRGRGSACFWNASRSAMTPPSAPPRRPAVPRGSPREIRRRSRSWSFRERQGSTRPPSSPGRPALESCRSIPTAR